MNGKRRHRNKRKGNIIVLTAFLLIGLMAMMAFAIDLGFICVTRQQLQRTADAAAMAACWKLLDDDALTGFADPAIVETNARSEATLFASKNRVLQHAPQLAYGDVQVGFLQNPSDPLSSLVIGGPEPANAVTVRVRRADDINGAVPLFFARALGITDATVVAEATAALLTGVSGFRAPPRGGNLGMLPLTLDEDTYYDMINGVGNDGLGWDPVREEVCSGADGVVEVSLFPQGTGSPGNRGTVDIGSSNNSTNDIARQITGGVSPGDLDYHGGELKFDAEGFLYLNGDTGISAGVKDELASIIGQPRAIPIFREVHGNGNNATYKIVAFAGVRIMSVKLTGSMSKKNVTIQPAKIVMQGTIPSDDGQKSSYIYSPAWLVR